MVEAAALRRDGCARNFGARRANLRGRHFQRRLQVRRAVESAPEVSRRVDWKDLRRRGSAQSTDDLPPRFSTSRTYPPRDSTRKQHRREKNPGRISAGHRLGDGFLWGLYSAQFWK